MIRFFSPRRVRGWSVVMALLLLVLTACGQDNSTTISLPSSSPATSPATAANPAPTSATTAAASATGSAVTAQPGTGPTTSASSTPGNVPTVKVSQTTQEEVARIAQQTAKSRGLNFKQAVETNFMTRADLAKYQEEQFRKDNPPAEIARYTKILQIQGLVPQGFDLARVYIDLLNEQVLGFYDPETKKLYIVSEDPTRFDPLSKFTAEHELTHGLQDQFYDLQKLRPIRKPTDPEGNDDRDYARTSLIEGDATQSQLVWLQGNNLPGKDLQELLRNLNNIQSDQLDKVPLILKETLTFPYEAGAQFVQKIYQKGGWAAVDKAFKEYPPQSTSQILHSEKYDNKIEPVKVQFSSMVDTLGSGWKSLDINTMGEMQSRVWLQSSGLDKAVATDAVKGWAGDRYQALENGNGQLGLIWRSQWDSEADAVKFYKNTLLALPKLYNLSGNPAGAEPRQTWTSNTQDITIIRKGKEVLLIVMPKGTSIQNVTAKLGF